ncbi:MAG: 50S ribosomal protein L22 [Bacteroidetes bacterium]|nr:50S ribosomal protein L22 [Bacteroidota bacterium]MDQ3191243.1 50S ribosomal protein L22 [Bacteroidota bacterium]
MGTRKKITADARKEARKSTYIAKLNDCPTSPRKMRLVADMVRGLDVYKALSLLQFTSKQAAVRIEKLITSAIANFETKSGQRAGDSNLFVKEIFVDSGRQLKRLRPAPQGRGHRIRKRSNHVTVILDNKEVVNEVNNSN